jgi:undecaprenyl diphosphate synthase
MAKDRPAVPRHVAVIMDGNGRWAAERGLSRLEGHRVGVEAVRAVVRACAELDIAVLTLYAFSSENWSRPRSEVRGLFAMLNRFLRSETRELVENGVRLRPIGRLSELPAATRKALDRAVEATSRGDGMTLAVALAYGGQDEIVDAARALAGEAVEGGIAPAAIDRDDVERRLYTAGLPPVDLLIRTGGELRISNFLLWQLSYAELYFTRTCWPDFDGRELEAALADFASRKRRFGGLAGPSS